MSRTSRTLGLLAATASIALALTACGSSASNDNKTPEPSTDATSAADGTWVAPTSGLGSKDKPVKLGVVGAGDEYWTTYKTAVEAEGISLELVNFSDYNQLNPAVSAGDLDINQFQHIIFLANYNVSNNDTLVPIGATAIYPLGLYSQKYKDVKDIKKGETVLVPNDTTNQARGLLVLQSAGLVKLKDGGSPSSTLNDIEKDASKVEVKAVDAALTASSLQDVAAAIVNNDYLGQAGLTQKDAIAADDPSQASAFPYINIFATTKANADNKVLNKLVEIYQTNKDVLAGVQENAGGTAVFATNPASELQKSLTDVEADLKKK